MASEGVDHVQVTCCSLDAVTGSLVRNNCIDVVYLDFSKAFDKVRHVRLLDKVNKHGIGGKVWSWIKEWLCDRKQRVCISGHSSSWISVTSGVTQGSVLARPIIIFNFHQRLGIWITEFLAEVC